MESFESTRDELERFVAVFEHKREALEIREKKGAEDDSFRVPYLMKSRAWPLPDSSKYM